jgi:hypothetical protein
VNYFLCSSRYHIKPNSEKKDDAISSRAETLVFRETYQEQEINATCGGKMAAPYYSK